MLLRAVRVFRVLFVQYIARAPDCQCFFLYCRDRGSAVRALRTQLVYRLCHSGSSVILYYLEAQITEVVAVVVGIRTALLDMHIVVGKPNVRQIVSEVSIARGAEMGGFYAFL